MDALQQYECEEIFTDKVSGVKDKRVGLEEALRFVRPGDTLVVWRLDRLGRNMQHLIQIVNDLNAKRINYKGSLLRTKNLTVTVFFNNYHMFRKIKSNY